MKCRIRITDELECRLRDHLLRGAGADEEAAFLLAATAEVGGGVDLIVREMSAVPDEALLQKGRSGLVIDPVFIARVLKQARLGELSIILCHSHPFTTTGVRFSSIDDGGEQNLFPRFVQQVSGLAHAAIVYGQSSVDARVWLPDANSSKPVDEIVVVGQKLRILSPTGSNFERANLQTDDATCRQALALGVQQNDQLRSLRVGIVGAGGVGSVVLEAVARMGVASIVLVDADPLALSNVSRVVGSTVDGVSMGKAEVLASHIKSIGLGTQVEVITEWVQSPEAVEALRSCDVAIVGTDTMKSRLFVARLGAQFLIPVLSVGVDIYPGVDEPMTIGGHIALQLPDGPCIDCLGLVDHNRLELEEMIPEVRVAHPYIRGHDPGEAEPSVIAFNLVVGGLVATELLQLATSRLRDPGPSSYLMYNGGTGEMRRVAAKRIRSCGVCDQVHAWGDRYDLPYESDDHSISSGVSVS